MQGLEALVEAAKAGDVEAVRQVIAATPTLAAQRLPSGESALMAALYRGHHAVVETLIGLGAPVDIFAAAATGRLDDLEKALLEPGAVNACAYDGWTPLHLSSFFGHVEGARLLLDSGADVHAISRNSLKNTPLHAATAGRHPDVALLLLDRGADPLVTDAGGYSAEKIAAENQLTEVSAAISRRRL